MKKILFMLIALSIFTSCKNVDEKYPSFHFGTVEYYPKFLFCESKLVKLEKNFIFEFSEDAKVDKNCFAELEFVDKEGKQISTDLMRIEIDGKFLDENIYKVQSNSESGKIVFSFSENAESGKYQGYIKLANHKLDRFGNQQLENGQQVEVMKWSIYYDKQWNPLAIILFMVGCFLILSLLFWFLVLRPLLYPHFGKCRKSILVMENSQMKSQFNIVFTGARMIVISNQKISQSFFDKCFKGKILSIVNPYFEEPLKFTPAKKKRIRVLGMNYISTPNPMPYNGTAEIKNIRKNVNLKIR